MTFGMYAMLFLTPLYLQNMGHMSAFMAAVCLLPATVTFFAVSQANGWIVNRLGARVVTTAGLACMGIGLLMLSRVSSTPDLLAVASAMFIIGVGVGLNTAPVNAVAVASVPPARAGTASGLINTARMVGATLGVAVLGAIYAAHEGGGDAAAALPGLRLAYFTGGGVELAGALVALLFIRADSTEQRRTPVAAAR
jgi:predicted MFS family arabinose efflux permease